jgi:anti-sigma factor RsiW
MSGQVLGFTGSAHQAAFALLPWFVNGTLDASEQAQVEQHLQSCVTCRRERAWLVQLGASWPQGEVLVDADRGFAHLVEQLEGRRPPTPLRAAVRPAARLAASLASAGGTWLRFAVALQLGVILALSWVLFAGAPAYRTLGANQGAAREQGTLIVVFQPAATESDVRRILRSVHARIVDGPTAEGAYVLAVDDTPGMRAAALERLRSDRAVKLAEALAPEPPR